MAKVNGGRGAETVGSLFSETQRLRRLLLAMLFHHERTHHFTTKVSDTPEERRLIKSVKQEVGWRD